MNTRYRTEILEETADSIVDEWTSGYISGLADEGDYTAAVGRPESADELRNVSEVSCLNEHSFKELEDMFEDNNIHYTLISLDEGEEPDAYLRSYDIKQGNDSIRAVATLQANWNSINETDGFKKALAFEYLDAQEKGADRFAVSNTSLLPKLNSDEVHNSEAQLVSKPFKKTYKVESNRRSIPTSQSRIFSTNSSLSNSSISS